MLPTRWTSHGQSERRAPMVSWNLTRRLPGTNPGRLVPPVRRAWSSRPAYSCPNAIKSWARAVARLNWAWTSWAEMVVSATWESPSSMMLPTPAW